MAQSKWELEKAKRQGSSLSTWEQEKRNRGYKDISPQQAEEISNRDLLGYINRTSGIESAVEKTIANRPKVEPVKPKTTAEVQNRLDSNQVKINGGGANATLQPWNQSPLEKLKSAIDSFTGNDGIPEFRKKELAMQDKLFIPEYDMSNKFDRIKAKYRLGQLADTEGVEWAKVAEGEKTTHAMKVSQAIEEMYQRYPDLFLEVQAENPSLFESIKKFVVNIPEATAEMLPTMLNSIKSGAIVGGAGALAGGGTAAIAGQLGPQVALPEELATVPAGALFGFSQGSKLGAASYMYQVEKGQAYKTMLDEGVDPDTANKWSTAVGLANAGLEVAQLGTLMKSLGVADDAIKPIASGVLDKYLNTTGKKAAAQFVTGVATETGQEVAQEAISMTGEYGAKKQSGIDAQLFSQENGQRLLDTAIQSAQAFIGLQGAGQVTGSAYRAGKRTIKEKIADRKNIETVVKAVEEQPEILDQPDIAARLDELENTVLESTQNPELEPNEVEWAQATAERIKRAKVGRGQKLQTKQKTEQVEPAVTQEPSKGPMPMLTQDEIEELLYPTEQSTESTVKSEMKQEKIDTSKLKINDSMVDSHSGQVDMVMSAEADGKKVGYVEYSIYNGKANISMIEVPEQYRRNGIAKKMLQQLQEQNPDTEIEWGMTTPDGTALKNSITYTVEDPEIAPLIKEYKDVTAEIQRIDDNVSKGNISDEEGERWNQLYDRQQVLERELYGKSGEKTFIKTEPKTTESPVSQEVVQATTVPKASKKSASKSKKPQYDGQVYYKDKKIADVTVSDGEAYTALLEQTGGDAARVLKEFSYFSPELKAALEKVAEIQAKENASKSTMSQRYIDSKQNKDGKQNLYSEDFPEVQPYVKKRAEELLNDLDNTTKGERIPLGDSTAEWTGIPRVTSQTMARIKDYTGASYEDIRSALNGLINGGKKSNTALARRIEIIIDENLIEGYKTFEGIDIPKNNGYIQVRNKIEPNRIDIPEYQPKEYNYEGDKQLTMGLPGENVSVFDLDQQGVVEDGKQNDQPSTLSDEEKTRRAFEAAGVQGIVDTVEAQKMVHKQAVEVMKSLGREVVFFKAKKGEKVPDGFVFGNDNRIYVNVNQKTDNMIWHTIGHEFFHTVKNSKKHKEYLYEPLLDYAREQFTMTQKLAFLDTYSDVPEIQAQLMKDEDALLEEMLADEMGNSFVDKKFWQSIFDYSKELFGRMVSVIEKLLGKISGAKYETYISEEVAKNLQDQFTAIIGIIMTDNKISTQELNDVVGDVKYKIRAYHGTPHDFDKFTTEKIGTGEGAQAYGWGLYFAGKKSIAEWYRDKLSKQRKGNFIKDGKIIDLNDKKALLEEYFEKGTVVDSYGGFKDKVLEFNWNDGDWNVVVQDSDVNGNIVPGSNPRRHFTQPSQSELSKTLIAKGWSQESTKGKFYEVDLAPDEEHMLDWDEKIDNQSDYVKNIIKKAIDETSKVEYELKTAKKELRDFEILYSPDPDKPFWNFVNDFPDAIGEQWRSLVGKMMVYETKFDQYKALWENSHLTGERFYNGISYQVGSDKATSLFLKSIGIPGIKYLDATSRGGGADGTTYNYVVFADEDVEVAAKYSARRKKEIENAFKDSKVKSVVYHGGNPGNVFDTTKGTGVTRFGAGAYFSDAYGVSEEWALERGGTVGEYMVNIEKPFDLTDYPLAKTKELNNLSELLKKEGMQQQLINAITGDIQPKFGPYANKSPFEIMNTYFSNGEKSLFGSGVTKVNELLRKAGFDGIIADFRDSKEFVVFEPNQIKSLAGDNPVDVKSADTTNSVRNRQVREGYTDVDPLEEPQSNKTDSYTVEKTVHDKTGKDIWIVKPLNKLPKDVYQNALEEIKKAKGYYSGFVKGFVFKEEPSLDFNSLFAFEGQEEATSKPQPSEPKAEKVEVSEEEKRKVKADKLRSIADGMQKQIDDKFRDRLSNTNRRANMAASAYADGEALQKRQTIIRAVADDIEAGEAKRAVANFTTKADIEMAYKFTQYAIADFVNAKLREKFGNNYSTLDKDKIEITRDAANYTKMPSVTGEVLGYYLRDFAEKDGFKRDVANALKRHKKGDTVYFHMYPEVVNLLEKAVKVKDGYLLKDRLAEFRRLEKLGITSPEGLQQLVFDFIPYYQNKQDNSEAKKQREIKMREQELARTKIEGFFPTPKKIVEQMLELADIQNTDKVLEPSAGAGSIADEIGVGKVDVVEWNSTLNSLLKEKGHNVVGSDVFEVTGQYDKIVMNPPFEKLQDVDHVMKVYNENLKPGGRIVAIMSESPFFRSDKKASDFREWLDGVGYSEKLPDGSFKESDRQTGVNTRIVVIDKPEKSKKSTSTTADYRMDNMTSNVYKEAATDKVKPIHEIVKDIGRDFKVAVTSKRFKRRKAYAHYKSFPQAIETSVSNTIGPIIHELGHHFDYKYGISKNKKYNGMIQSMIDQMPEIFKANYKSEELKGEAIAEFLRIYMTMPSELSEYAGEFVNEFENLISKEDLSKLKKHQSEILGWLNSSIEAQVNSALVSYFKNPKIEAAKKNPKAHMELIVKKAYMHFFNELQPLHDFARYIEKISGKKLSNSQDFYLLADSALRSSMIAKAITTDALLDPQGNVIGDSFKSIFKDITVADYEALSEYLIAKRAIDYDKRGKRAFSDDLPIDYIKKMVDKIEIEKPQYVETANKLYSWWDSFTRAWVVGTGLIEPRLYDYMRKLEPHYVPFFRQRDEATIVNGVVKRLARQGFTDQRNPIKRSSMSGGADPIYYPIESMIMEIERYVTTVKKRDVMLAVHDVYQDLKKDTSAGGKVLQEGLGYIINEVNPQMLPDSVNMKDKKLKLALNLYDAYSETLSPEDKIEYEVIKKDAIEFKATFEDVLNFFAERGFNAMEIVNEVIDDTELEFKPVDIDKETNIVTVKDRQNKTHHYEVYDQFLLEALLNMDTSNIDAVTRSFALIRRTMQSLITTFDPTFVARNFMRDIMQGNVASSIPMHKYHLYIIQSIHDEITNGEWSKSFRRSGGGFSSKVGADRNALAESMAETIPGWKKKHKFQTVLQGVEKFADAVEQAPRLAEYRYYVEQNGNTFDSRLKALFEAQDVTVNFQRKGQIMRHWYGQILPFFNAALQGIDKNARLNTVDIKKTLPRALFSLTMISLALFAVNRDDPEYDKLSAYIKDSYWLIPTGVNGRYIRIPKPRELGFMYGSSFERVLDQFIDKNPEAWDGFLTDMKQVFIPEFSTVFAPLNQAMNNRTWYGGQIVPYAYQKLQPDQQYTNTTSWIAKEMAKLIPDNSQLSSPMVLDYLFQQYTGVIGKTVIPITDEIEGNAGLSLKKPFVADVAISNDSVRKFYEKLDSMNKIVATAKMGRMPKGSYNEAEHEVYKNTAEAIQEINKLYESIDGMKSEEFRPLNEKTGMSKEELKRFLKLEVLRLATATNKLYNSK